VHEDTDIRLAVASGISCSANMFTTREAFSGALLVV
jgi:hypothetical protein